MAARPGPRPAAMDCGWTITVAVSLIQRNQLAADVNIGAGVTLTLKQIHEDLKELRYESSYDRVAAFTK